MDGIKLLAMGFSAALTGPHLLSALLGTLLGFVAGVMPGVSLLALMAMLLPFVRSLDALSVLILLAAVYCGAQHGSSTAAMLTRMQGERRSGRAMLAFAGLGSLFAACVGTAFIAAVAWLLAPLSARLGAVEYCSLMVLILAGTVALGSGSVIKAVAMIVLGLLLGQVNRDVMSGTPRFSLGIPQLTNGLSFMALALGVFGIGGAMAHLGHPMARRKALTGSAEGPTPKGEDFRHVWPSVLRGTALGSLLGMLPGAATLLASFASGSLEKQLARDPGIASDKGALQEATASTSAHSAGARTSLTPLLILGIPPNAAMALMMGAMTPKDAQPGLHVMGSTPGLFWALMASLWIGSLILFGLKLLLIAGGGRLLARPYRLLFPATVVFCCVGAYALKQDGFDVYMVAFFALLGYVLRKLGCEPASLLLGFIVGPLMEEKLRGALLSSEGSWSVFVTRPLSAGLLVAAAALVIAVMLPTLRSRRQVIFQDKD